MPHGYICSSVADLLTAYRLLLASHETAHQPQRHTHQPPAAKTVPVLLKPLTGGGEGEGLLVVSDEDQLRLYDFHESEQVVLQELLTLDRWALAIWAGSRPALIVYSRQQALLYRSN